MSRVERKEYQETRTTRTMSPTRIIGSSQNISEFDNNLDHLLEDLQSTISRPGSSLALNGNNNTFRDSSRSYNLESSSNRSNSLNRITTKPVTEYSTDDSYAYTSPDGSKNVKTVKKEVYSYKTSGGRNKDLPPERISMQNNINQLDSLLDDLQQVKKNGSNNNNVGPEPGYQYSKSKIISGKKIVERDVPTYKDRTRSLDRSDVDNSITSQIESYRNEGIHTNRSNNSTLTRQTKHNNYPMEVSQSTTTTPDIHPEILANLDPELLPSANTKVTTTIKTYTYEIPGTGTGTGGRNTPVNTTMYSLDNSNVTSTTPSKSFVYNQYENNSLSRNYKNPPGFSNTNTTEVYRENNVNNAINNVPAYKKPTAPGGVIKETVTTRNYQPNVNNNVYNTTGPNKQTYVYNETTTTRNVHDYPTDREIRVISDGTTRQRSSSGNRSGASSPYLEGVEPDYHVSEIIQNFETQTHNNNTTNVINRDHEVEVFDPKYPPYNTTTGSRSQHYVVNNTTSTSTSTNTPVVQHHHHPPPSSPKLSPRGPPAQHHRGEPAIPHPNNNTATYKYITHHHTSSNTNTNSNHPGYGNQPNNNNNYPYNNNNDPQLYHPRKFPVDNADGPPRDVNELMKNIGAEPPASPYNAGYLAHESEVVQQRKAEQLRHQHEMDEQRKEPLAASSPRSKNVTGPPVYYPPDHEMFARKEEGGGGAWRAQGEMAKESGKYKYEAESGSKTKMRSGAAVVPVCLPLCCGLPCTIL